MPIPSWTKRLAVRLLPRAALLVVKRRHYIATVRRFGVEEEPDLAVVRHLVRPGDVTVDIGANVGIYTRALSTWVGTEGVVFAVEPVPDTHMILHAVVQALELRNVCLVRAAFSDRAGRSVMEIPQLPSDEGHYFARLVGTVAQNPDVELVEVRTATIDDELHRHLGRIAFVKCDVEGHELAVVDGAAGLLQAARPAWLIEIGDNPDVAGSAAARLVARLERAGYGMWRFDGEILRRRVPGDRSVNYFFLTDAHLDRLRLEAPTLLAAQPSAVT